MPPDPKPVRVAIVDDDPGIRAGLSALIRHGPALQFHSEHPDAETALAQIPSDPPDVVLMDINLPGMNGVECVRALKAIHPGLQVLMLTVYEDSDSLFDSLKAGASGYLLKRTAAARLLEAIQEVHEGGAPLSPQLARRVVQHFNAPPPGKTPALTALLSPAEQDFLDQLARGYTYKEIAARMHISVDTVRNHVRSVYDKLHVHSRTQAVVKYLRA